MPKFLWPAGVLMKIQIYAFLFQRFQLVCLDWSPGNMCLSQSGRMPQLGIISLPETTHSVHHRALPDVSFSGCHAQVKTCLNSLPAQTNNSWRELLENKKKKTPDWLTWLCILRIKCSGIFLRFAIQLSQFPLSVLFSSSSPNMQERNSSLWKTHRWP